MKLVRCAWCIKHSTVAGTWAVPSGEEIYLCGYHLKLVDRASLRDAAKWLDGGHALTEY